MPHYADGSLAQVGDKVKGKPYNTPHEVVGELIQITPGTESCNCIVAFAEVMDADSYWKTCYGALHGFISTVSKNGVTERKILIAKTDYGETKAFSKIA